MTAYYIDNAGSDGASGLSGSPWQTKIAVNAHNFSPGDQLIFTAGQTFAGPFIFNDNGSSGNYISIGTGRATTPTQTPQSNPAIITAPDGAVLNGISIEDAEYIWLDNLKVQGSGVNTATGATTSTAAGISLKSSQTTNRLRNVHVYACTVTGCRDGIFAWTNNATGRVGWDVLSIWGCDVYACQRVGIIVSNYDVANNSGGYAQGSGGENRFVYIQRCQVYDMPGKPGGEGVGNCGEGIVVRNTFTGGLVEYCVAHDINVVGDQGNTGGTAGIDTAVASDITVQYCEIYNVWAPQTVAVDGVGLDFESNSFNCTAQYNYIHDCDGAAYLSGTVVAAQNSGNVFRYNVCARNAALNQTEIYDFGARGAGVGQTVSSIIYCNTIYASNAGCYEVTDGGTDSLYNNILISKAGEKCVDGTPNFLIGNCYYALGGGTITVISHTSLAALRAAGFERQNDRNCGVFADPQLISPTSGAGVGTLPDANVSTIIYFDILRTSPAAAGSASDLSPGLVTGTDFHGNPDGSPGLFNPGVMQVLHNAGRSFAR